MRRLMARLLIHFLLLWLGYTAAQKTAKWRVAEIEVLRTKQHQLGRNIALLRDHTLPLWQSPVNISDSYARDLMIAMLGDTRVAAAFAQASNEIKAKLADETESKKVVDSLIRVALEGIKDFFGAKLKYAADPTIKQAYNGFYRKFADYQRTLPAVQQSQKIMDLRGLREVSAALEDGKKTVLAFLAANDAASTQMKPYLAKLAAENESIRFCMVRIDDPINLKDKVAEAMKVQGVPLLVAIEAKKSLGQVYGPDKEGVDQLMLKLGGRGGEAAKTAMSQKPQPSAHTPTTARTSGPSPSGSVGKVHEIKDLGELMGKVQTGIPIVLDVYATDCSPCKLFAPEFHRLSGLYPQFHFLKINAQTQEKPGELLESLGVKAVPTILAFVSGKLAGRCDANGTEQLIQRLTSGQHAPVPAKPSQAAETRQPSDPRTSSAQVVEITTLNELSDYVSTGRKIVLDLGGKFCSDCQTFKPTFLQSSKRHPEITFLIADVQSHKSLQSLVGDLGLPAVRLYNAGNQVAEFEVDVERNNFEAELSRFVAS